MTKQIDTLAQVASYYDAIVLDQWGVLHDGSTPYPGSIEVLDLLVRDYVPLAVLSNSGKRAAPNAARIADMGFREGLFQSVMTSGEALWQDIASGRIKERVFLPIERAPGDAARWAEGLGITLTDQPDTAEALLIMGLPDGSTLDDWQGALVTAQAHGLPAYCSNPDRASPRAGGLVISPGALAFAYKEMSGDVRFYGKPHQPIFQSVSRQLGTSRLLMVGDSLEHDIAGGQGAGWDTLLVTGGLYAAEFATGDHDATLSRLVADKGCDMPTYSIGTVQ